MTLLSALAGFVAATVVGLSVGGTVAIVCVVRAARLDALLDAAFQVVERHIGSVSFGDCEVLRAGRF
ncbi:MAG: hypothetical protein AAGA11_01345 [Pseudomonadota bacterium]